MDYIHDIEKYISKGITADTIEWTRRNYVTSQRMVGGRVPTLRRVARDIVCKGFARKFLDARDVSSFELITIRGFVIAYSKDIDGKFNYLDRYLEDIDNWASVDYVINAIDDRSHVYRDYLIGKLTSDNKWAQRFGIVGLMDGFLAQDRDILIKIISVDSTSYTVDMAIAWAISNAYVIYGNKVFDALRKVHLSPNIIRYTIAKVNDSYRLTKDEKTTFKNKVIR